MKQEVKSACALVCVGLLLTTAVYQWCIPFVCYIVLMCYAVARIAVTVASHRLETLINRAVTDAVKDLRRPVD